MAQNDTKILREGLAWLAVAAGMLLLIASIGPTGAPDLGYLSGVWERSLSNLYQGAILAGVLAVVPHHISVHWRYGDIGAYDRFAAWAQTLFTSLGFLGTVVGVSLAVAGLEQAMLEENPAKLISGLSTAFDTTFLGLSGAVILLVLRKISRPEQVV